MNEPHLFSCEPCRAEWRLRRASGRQLDPAGLEIDDPVEERFVERVLAAVRQERQRRLTRLARLAAAAALLFFFFAGAGREGAATTVAGAEQAYAQLASSSDLDGLLPD